MANTVTILSYTNTFGDLLAQQNKAAVEINNISANNYTKETGTLYLANSNTGLFVTNTAILGAGIVSGALSLLGTTTSSNVVYLNGLNYALNVANNAIIAKTLITDNFTANTIVRTGTINASGTAFVNGITANTIIRSQILNASDTAYVNGITANTIIRTQTLNASSLGVFENVVANTNITTQNLLVNGAATITSGSFTGAATITSGSFTGSATITSGSFTGQASLTGTSTAVTTNTNAANTQIATTAWVKNVLNSGNTFSITAATANALNAGNDYNGAKFTSQGTINFVASGTPATSNSSIYNYNGIAANIAAFGVSTNNGGGTYTFDGSGNFVASGSVTAYSDSRLKTNVQTIVGALDKVTSMRGVTFEKNGTKSVGVIAQEIREILPEVVIEGNDEQKTLSVAYGNIVSVLIEAIKELKQEIDLLKK